MNRGIFGFNRPANFHPNPLALGQNAVAKSNNSLAIGKNCTASGIYSIVIGNNNSATQYTAGDSVTTPTYNSALGPILIGSWNFTTKSSYGIISIGTLNNQTTSAYLSTGSFNVQPTGATTIGALTTAIGFSNSTSSTYDIAIGVGNISSGAVASISIGLSNTASGNSSIAIGRTNTASSSYSIGIGYHNTASGSRSSVFGYYNSSPSANSLAIGYKNSMNSASLNCVLVGRENFGTSTSFATVAFGVLNNQQSGTLNTSTGAITGTPAAAGTVGRLCTAVGISNTTSGNYSSAIGYSNTSSGITSLAVGYGNSMNSASLNCILVGRENFGTSASFATVAFGILNNQQSGSISGSTGAITGTPAAATTVGRLCTAIGIKNITSANNSTACGYNNTASGASSVAVGVTNTASSTTSVAVGNNNTSSSTVTVAIGSTNAANQAHAIAIGASNTSSGSYSITIGSSCTASGTYSIAIGKSASTNSNASSIVICADSAGYTSSAANQLIIGSITTAYFGNGVTNASPNNIIINATGGSGSNIAGGSLTIAGGIGTGTGAGGSVIIQVAPAGSTGSSANTLATVITVASNKSVTISNAIIHPFVSPSALAANTNDYAPTAARNYRLTTDGSNYNLTGLSISQADGQLVTFINIHASAVITIKNQDAGSTAANRFLTASGADIALDPNGRCDLIYDNTTSRWRAF